jgi:hypothetical protein
MPGLPAASDAATPNTTSAATIFVFKDYSS